MCVQRHLTRVAVLYRIAAAFYHLLKCLAQAVGIAQQVKCSLGQGSLAGVGRLRQSFCQVMDFFVVQTRS